MYDLSCRGGLSVYCTSNRYQDEQQWRVVWVGALVTSLLFNFGAYLIGLYLGYGGAQSLLGAAGSLVILMLWISSTAQIIFFGAKFAFVYAAAIGKPILPAAHAVGFKLSRLDTTPTDQE